MNWAGITYATTVLTLTVWALTRAEASKIVKQVSDRL